MKNIKPNTDKSPEALRLQLKEVINKSNLSKESQEYLILTNSVDIAIEAIWSSAWQVVKCVAGTAGSAGLGAIAGASVGTITLHVVGTVSGTAVGGWSGSLVGIASFC